MSGSEGKISLPDEVMVTQAVLTMVLSGDPPMACVKYGMLIGHRSTDDLLEFRFFSPCKNFINQMVCANLPHLHRLHA